MSTEAVVLLVITGVFDAALVGLTLGMRFTNLIDCCSPFGTDTPERQRKIGRERARRGILRAMYVWLFGAAVMTASVFIEGYTSVIYCVGFAVIMISAAVFLVWYYKNTRIKK
ncbi:MAG TPA: hypothetical protein IAB47_03660 [Candidatus Scatomorpha merdigallinarum]|nr:hypothetical protein [Candidatus Scatomorpha merdigallinarum]